MVNLYRIRDLSPYVTYEVSVTGGNYQGFENAATTFILTSEEGIIQKIKIVIEAYVLVISIQICFDEP